jgi:hypothetical protein
MEAIESDSRVTLPVASLAVPDLEKDLGLVSLDMWEDPLYFSPWKKWVAVTVISSGSFCVACASSMVR